MPTLYSNGWRQCQIIHSDLPIHSVVVVDSDLTDTQSHHDLWAVVTQDCDLDQSPADSNLANIELRPVFTDDPPTSLGIRSRRFKLRRGYPHYLHAESLRLMISPAALSKLLDRGDVRQAWLDESQSTALKLWLGLRYDRPAVPDELGPLARAIGEAVRIRTPDPTLDSIREVLAQFEPGTPPHFALFAVVVNDANKDAVREVLGAAALDVPQDLGILDELAVTTAREASLELIETSISVDLTQITWGRGEPRGAY